MDSPVAEDEVVYLTLGDGDFTFSLDLARYLIQQQQHQQNTGHSGNPSHATTVRVIATGIDSVEALSDKYHDFLFVQKQLDRLSRQGHECLRVQNGEKLEGKKRQPVKISLHHQVNAVVPRGDRLAAVRAGDHVIFNYPHLGVEDAELHFRFLCHLFESVSRVWLKKCTHDSRRISAFHLALAKGQFERWNCLVAAQRHGFRLVDRSIFAPPPVEDSYYMSRRHQTGKSFTTRTGGPSEMFTFVSIEARIATSVPLNQAAVLDWYKARTKELVATAKQKTETQQDFKCPHCDKVFGEKRSVRNHILSRHGGDRKRKRESETFSCESCSKLFSSAGALQDHIQAKHKGIHTTIHPDATISVAMSTTKRIVSCPPTVAHRCDICLCEFSHQAAQARHLDEFTPLDRRCAKTFECSFCGKVFHQDRARRQHENFCPSTRIP